MGKSFFGNLNAKINKLSKTAMILVLAVYAVILGGIYTLVTVTRNYLVIPEYEHVYFNEQVNPQITIIGRRTFDDSNKMTLKYSVNVSTYGRISASSSVDPGYSLTDFKMSAATVDTITSKAPNNMYYFTEYTTYTTPTTHYYSLDNTSVNQHPNTIYTMIQYKKNGNTQIATFKEDIWLFPSDNDIASFDTYYSNPANQDATSRNINDKQNAQIANIQFVASNQTDYYSSGLKITMNKLDYTSRHHVDMQSWILTEDGKYLPFIGVYSYSQQKTNYSQTGISVYKQLKPQYICSKLRYYFSETEFEDYYFKQEFSKLATSLSSTPSTGDDGTGKTPNANKTAIIVAVSCTCAVLVCGGVCGGIILSKKYKKTKENEAQDVSSNEEKNEIKE